MSVLALQGHPGTRVSAVTSDEARDARIGAQVAADLLGIDRRTLYRLDKTALDYWQTPGGGVRRHRRYRRADLERFARDVLGREIGETRE